MSEPDNALPRKVILLCLSMLTVMSGATVSASLPEIARYYAGEQHILLLTQMVLSAPAIAIALTAPVMGSVADRLGRRKVLVPSLVLYGFAGASGLVLESLYGIIAGRVLLGLSVAGTMTVTTALVGDYFSGTTRDRFMGLLSMGNSIGGVVFLVGGGFLAELNWRSPFGMYLLAFVLLPFVLAALPEPGKAAAPSANEAAPDVTDIAWGRLLVLLAMAMIVFAIFYLIPAQLPFLLADIGLDAPRLTGIAIGTMTLFAALSALMFGRVRERLGMWPVFVAGFASAAFGYYLVSAAEGYIAILIAMALSGSGIGLVIPNIMTSIIGLAPATMRGRVSGWLTSSVFFGQFLAPIIAYPLVTALGIPNTFATMAVALVLLAVLSAMLAVFLRRNNSARAREQ